MEKTDIENLSRSLPTDPVPWRLSLPAKAAFDIASIHKVVDNFARAIGCERCFSGRHCLFTLERDFVVNPASLDVQGIGQR
jgi:hypothetical protein